MPNHSSSLIIMCNTKKELDVCLQPRKVNKNADLCKHQTSNNVGALGSRLHLDNDVRRGNGLGWISTPTEAWIPPRINIAH